MQIKFYWAQNEDFRDFTRGPVVKNPPSNAEEVVSITGRGTKIPHATGQLNLGTTNKENPLTTTKDPTFCD